MTISPYLCMTTAEKLAHVFAPKGNCPGRAELIATLKAVRAQQEEIIRTLTDVINHA
jgi:hypothetical protein